MYKPINRRYHDLDDDTKQPYVAWNIKGDTDIEVPDLVTYGQAGEGKEELDALIQQVIDNYEESL